ncbi:sporulation protein [Phytomonospora sp. NPDC050363]|uniref:sporulation protein n=1 Tax=Phytomonospora sp. NPDC050363 TaxID=3155642 RepID=UPI0033ED2B3D
MVLRRLLAAFGAGVEVDTLLSGSVRPGGTLSGEVRFSSGKSDHRVTAINLEFVAEVEVEREGQTHKSRYEFFEAKVAGEVLLAAGSTHSVPFALPVPWETPLSTLGGHQLYGIRLGVSTELELAGALDKGDLDPLHVEPLPVHEAVLNALGRLGFTFSKADLESGTIPGSQMPFYQEIEYWPGGQFRNSFKELELTFVTGPSTVDVILEADRRGGFLSAGRDALNRFTLPHSESGDLTALINEKLGRLSA